MRRERKPLDRQYIGAQAINQIENMSHYIPIFFFSISEDEIPENLDKWYSAEKLLSAKWEKHEQNGFRSSVSRNWWHQHAISLICEHLQISGLEFLQLEIACLNSEQIDASIKAIDKFLNSCQHGIPELTPEMENSGSIWYLRNDIEANNIKKFSTTEIEKAFYEASAVSEIKGMADSGYNALVEFFSFLKTLRASLQECSSQNKKLLYVQPQP